MYDSHNDSLVNDERLNYEMIFSPRLRLQHLPFSKNEYLVNDERLNYEMILSSKLRLQYLPYCTVQYTVYENRKLSAFKKIIYKTIALWFYLPGGVSGSLAWASCILTINWSLYKDALSGT